MNANDVLIDLLEDNRRRLKRVFEAMDDDCLYWSPDPEANNIAVTTWHMGRLFDVFLTKQVKGGAAEKECWFSHGWAKETGYDPRGLGRDGWGSVNGYSLEEVAAMPRFTRRQLLGHLDDVYDSVRRYLEGTTIEELQTPSAGFEGRFTKYQCIQMALMDNVRHLGEMITLKAMWDRSQEKIAPTKA